MAKYKVLLPFYLYGFLPKEVMKSNFEPEKAMAPEPIVCCGMPTFVMLTTGQHINAGTVTIGNDANYL